MSEKKTDKETRKIVSEDVEKFFRDVWGKVVEYASLGAEEATKLSSTAKARVDVETLKFKKGKFIRMLGEQYLELYEKSPSNALPETREVLKEIKGIDKEIKDLEKEMSKPGKTGKKKPVKTAPVKPAAKKTAPGKTAPKKTVAKKTAVKKPAAKKPPVKKAAPRKTAPKKTAGAGESFEPVEPVEKTRRWE